MLRSLDTYDYEYRNFIDQDLHNCGFDFYQHNRKQEGFENYAKVGNDVVSKEWTSEGFNIKKFFESKLYDTLADLDDYNSNVKVA